MNLCYSEMTETGMGEVLLSMLTLKFHPKLISFTPQSESIWIQI